MSESTRWRRRARRQVPQRLLDPARVLIHGVPFDVLSEEGVVSRVMARSAEGVGGRVVTPNVSMVRLSSRGALRQLISEAELSVCDGAPVLWLSQILGTPLPARVTGSSLIYTISEAAAREGRSVFFLGGQPGAAESAAVNLSAAFPGLVIAGTSCPDLGFERDDERFAEVVDALVRARPDIVFVGLGFPKQELVSTRLREHLPGAWFVNCGAAIHFAAGLQHRAPAWMQRLGLEWVHRLAQEPRRLASRYAADLVFAGGLISRAVVVRLVQRGRSSRPVR
jgi:N-acetylglucosaminyldiphosphoundecaprenol N-acetyl-beta-D-mannosaminyltransferase